MGSQGSKLVGCRPSVVEVYHLLCPIHSGMQTLEIWGWEAWARAQALCYETKMQRGVWGIRGVLERMGLRGTTMLATAEAQED